MPLFMDDSMEDYGNSLMLLFDVGNIECNFVSVYSVLLLLVSVEMLRSM